MQQQTAQESGRASPPALPFRLLPDRFTVKALYHGKRTFEELRSRSLIVSISGGITDVTFPQKRRGEESVELQFADFGTEVAILEALAALSRECLRPANPVELISLSRKEIDGEPDPQIVALGQSHKDDPKRFVYLFGKPDDRDAHIFWGDKLPAHMLCAVVGQGTLL